MLKDCSQEEAAATRAREAVTGLNEALKAADDLGLVVILRMEEPSFGSMTTRGGELVSVSVGNIWKSYML